MELESWIANLEPKVPLETLVEEINKIFHSFDAALYDGEHPEIHQQLPPIWAEMIAQLPRAGTWKVLDLGCGTGFEAEQVLSNLGDKVLKLTAFDPSPEMLAQCKRKLCKSSRVEFCSAIEEIHGHGPFNLVLTNSLLHHLPNVAGTIKSLQPSLSDDAFWIAGHEPSAHFYRNRECLELLAAYNRWRKVARWFKFGSYSRRLRLILGLDPLSATANAVYKRGLLKKRPSSGTISRLVDFHVATSAAEVLEGRGLDIENLRASFQPDWTLRWSKSYSYLGQFKYASAPDRWVNRARDLERRFPLDGANFSMVWSRTPCDEVPRAAPVAALMPNQIR